MHERSFNWLKDHDIQLAMAIGVIILIVYVFAVIIPNAAIITPDQLSGILTDALISSIALAGSGITFALVILGPKDKWGEAKDFLVYIGLGSGAGLLASLVSLLADLGVVSTTAIP